MLGKDCIRGAGRLPGPSCGSFLIAFFTVGLRKPSCSPPMMVLKCASSPPQPRANPKSQILTYGGMCADSSVLSSFRSLQGKVQSRNTVTVRLDFMHVLLRCASIAAYASAAGHGRDPPCAHPFPGKPATSLFIPLASAPSTRPFAAPRPTCAPPCAGGSSPLRARSGGRRRTPRPPT